jgi:hyperosmotically inducible periplasmic protein
MDVLSSFQSAEIKVMRATNLLSIALLPLLLAGCERIDTSRTDAVSDPAMRTNDSQPPATSPTPSVPDDPAPSTPTPASSTEKVIAPDSTAINQRDASGDTKTAIDQKETPGDISVTADIRKRVIAAENMSMNARNVKIITEDGKTVIRGPVNSAEEKQRIDKMAREIAGQDNVDNQIEVVESKP